MKKRKMIARRRTTIRWVLGVLIVAFLVAASFGLYHLYRNTMSRILKTQTFTEEKLIVTTPSNGVILRDEEVIVAPKSGRWAPLVANASFVKVNDPVAEIYNYGSVRDYEKALQALQDNRKKDLELYNSRLAYYDESVETIRKEITGIEKQMQSDTVKNDAEAVARLTLRIDTLNQSITNLTLEKSTVNDNQQFWDDQEAGLIDLLRKDSTIVVSVYNGVISFSVDLYEGLLSTSELSSIGLADLSTFPYGRAKETEQELTAGKPLCKMVQAPWYWVTSYPIPAVLNLKVGDEAKLMTNLGNVIYAQVDSLRQEGDSVIVAYRFKDLVAEALLQRFPTMEWITKVDYGLILPSDLVIEKRNQTGVFLVTDGYAHFEEVTVLQNRNGYAMVTGLDKEIEIILNPRFALEGIRVGGE
jgi:hypothetical protein